MVVERRVSLLGAARAGDLTGCVYGSCILRWLCLSLSGPFPPARGAFMFVQSNRTVRVFAV